MFGELCALFIYAAVMIYIMWAIEKIGDAYHKWNDEQEKK